MLCINTNEDIQKLNQDSTHRSSNQILGNAPNLEHSSIKFNGKNNILYCEDHVRLKNTSIYFAGSNSLVFLRKSCHDYILDLSVNHNCVFHMGQNNYINNKVCIILSEQKHCFIGDNGLFSSGIWIRNADPHLVYQCETKTRCNPSKSIFIGDHVWIGQSTMILKGTQIDSGSILGAMSVCAGKKISHNSSWGGNPCKKIKDGIFWDGACVHTWTDSLTQNSQQYSDYLAQTQKAIASDAWIYQYDSSSQISYQELDQKLSDKINSKDKCDLLIQLNQVHAAKNRFVHTLPKKRFHIF